jgi:hypothetical protein
MYNTPDTSKCKILEIFKSEEASNGRIMIITFTPCMLLHLLYTKPNHALLLNTLSHPHFKNTKIIKNCFAKTSLNPYIFLSLLYDHPQGSSFVLSALPLLRLFASSSCLFGMWLYVVYARACVCVCVCARCTCLWDVLS